MHTAKLNACKDRYMPVHIARLLGAIVEPTKRHEARRQIKRLYAWDATTRREREGKTDKVHLIALIRLCELERLLQRRHGGALLPDDDDGRDSLELVAHHIAHLRPGEVENHIVAWAASWCPWMQRAEAEALAARVAAQPQRFKAATLGWRLRLTEAERAELKITTVRAFNVTDADMAERRRRRAREHKADQRRRERAGKALPLNRTRPWESAGVSRATWYRRRAASKTARETKPVRSRVEIFAADEICLTPGVRGEAAGHPRRKTTIKRAPISLSDRQMELIARVWTPEKNAAPT